MFKVVLKNIIRLVALLLNIYIIGINIYWFYWGYDVYTWILPSYVRTDYGLNALCNMENLFFVPIFIIINLIYIVIFIIKKRKKQSFKK